MVHSVLNLCCQSKRDLHRSRNSSVISFTNDGRETFLTHKLLFWIKRGKKWIACISTGWTKSYQVKTTAVLFFSLVAAKKRLSSEVTARSVLPQFFARFSYFCVTRSTFAFAFPCCTVWPVSSWSVTNEGCVRNPRHSLFIGFENFTVMNVCEGFISKRC